MKLRYSVPALTALISFGLIIGCGSDGDSGSRNNAGDGNGASGSGSGGNAGVGAGGTGNNGGGAGGSGGVNPRPSPDMPSTDTEWAEGLTMGPNGPIPVIVVDQFGYRPDARKIAIVRDPRTGYDAQVDYEPGTTFELVDAASGEVKFQGSPTAWSAGTEHELSGDAVWYFEFSEVTEPGTYFVRDGSTGRRSPHFEIRPDVYRSALKHAVRTLFYQRAGFEKTAEFAKESWADGASHLGAGQDGEARSWLDKTNAATAKDLRGGWYDAGDYNKYTSWHSRYLITLLQAFTEHPAAFGDDYDIPESGNGTPDVLDEVEYGLAWLLRVQNDDGSVFCVQGLGGASPPSAATQPSYYGPPTTAATLAAAAAYAYAARVLSTRSEARYAELVPQLVERAEKAWTWAVANPAVTYFNNDESKQPGSGGLAAGQQEMDDTGRLTWKVEAATYLFERTGKDEYRDFVDNNHEGAIPSWGVAHWQVDAQNAVLGYASLPNATASVAAQIKATFKDRVTQVLLPAHTQQSDAYLSPIDVYTWGSNHSKAAAGRLLLLANIHDVGLDEQSTSHVDAGAEEYLHYVHGRNPLGLVYLSNTRIAGAEHSVSTFYHTWFSQKSAKWSITTDTSPGPAPGFLVGGPNPSYGLDGCCTDGSECYGSADFVLCSLEVTPPLGQPDMKSYKQFNHGWPANSWSVTENSNGYQVQYIRLLAAYAE